MKRQVTGLAESSKRACKLRLKQKLPGLLGVMLALLGMACPAWATLVNIGSATYKGENYSLIWDNDNNGRSVVWLDYLQQGSWADVNIWADGLEGSLLYHIDPARYTVRWSNPSWRLPDMVDGIHRFAYDGSTVEGYNITSSELGHLFYEELGDTGLYDTSGHYHPIHGLGYNNGFSNLFPYPYWSGPESTRANSDATSAWIFDMESGCQYPNTTIWDVGYGHSAYPEFPAIAVRSGSVSTVPEPGTMLLFGAGLAGIASFTRRKRSRTKNN